MLRIFFVAGEPSGDHLGADLIQALRLCDEIEIAGVGGPAMADQGLDSLFDTSDLAIVGIVEAVPKIPMVWRRVQETVRHAIAFKPDVVVMAASSRAGDRLRALGLRVVALEPKTHADVQRVLRKLGQLLDARRAAG